jgi:hypothetical protein
MCEGAAAPFTINDGRWRSERSFSVLDGRGGLPTEARLRITWRRRALELYRGSELEARISSSILRQVRADFLGEMPGPDRLDLRGDFNEMNFRFVRGMTTVAVVSTVEGLGADSWIEVRPCEDHGLILAAALSVRQLCDRAWQTRRPARAVAGGRGIPVLEGPIAG